MLVHLVKAGEHRAEILRPDGDHRRQADRRVHRVAAADPVPEPKHVGRVDAERRDLLRRWSRPRRNASPPPPRRRRRPPAATARAVWALVIVSSVVNVFDDTMNSVSAGSRSRIASAKSVPSMFETKRNVEAAVAVVPQRLVRHHRPEVRAADADVDDVADPLAGVAVHAPLRTRSANVRHRRARRGPRAPRSRRRPDRRSRGARSATCSTARFSVMLIFSPPNIASMRAAQAALVGQLDQQPQRLVGDAVLRIIEVDAGGFGGSGARRAGSRAKSWRRWTSRSRGDGFECLPRGRLGERPGAGRSRGADAHLPIRTGQNPQQAACPRLRANSPLLWHGQESRPSTPAERGADRMR